MNDFLITRGLVPDFMVRRSIRHRLADRLKGQAKGGPSASERRLVEMMDRLKTGPITELSAPAGGELPAAFYEKVLGKHLKQSSGFWRTEVEDIHVSEADMLELIAWRADIQDGHRILDLGCGWGAFALFAARKYPKSQVLAVTNSPTQQAYVQTQALERGLKNLEVVASDLNAFRTEDVFDRVVSVEMFQHVQNYELMLEMIAARLSPDGKLFIHIFCHKKFAYPHDPASRGGRLAGAFFSKGIMPSEELLLYFDRQFRIEQRWRVPGQHYRHTCRAWLERMDLGRKELFGIFREVYGKDARKWWGRWRLFFMSCEELFGYNGGGEWFVSHYLFRKK